MVLSSSLIKSKLPISRKISTTSMHVGSGSSFLAFFFNGFIRLMAFFVLVGIFLIVWYLVVFFFTLLFLFGCCSESLFLSLLLPLPLLLLPNNDSDGIEGNEGMEGIEGRRATTAFLDGIEGIDDIDGRE